MSDIPEDVIEGLAAVRESAKANMLDQRAVRGLLWLMGHPAAATWIEANPDRYMDALTAMGERVNKDTSNGY